MYNPRLLIISQNSRARRLYHQLLESAQFELSFAHSVADALVLLLLEETQIVAIDDSLPVFEVTLLIEILSKKKDWKNLPVIMFGFQKQEHIFPHHLMFVSSEKDFVRKLSDLHSTV